MKNLKQVQFPVYLYRRITRYGPGLYQRFLPLLLVAEYAPGVYSSTEVDSLVEGDYVQMLAMLVDDKILKDTSDEKGLRIAVYPSRNPPGGRLFNVMVKPSFHKTVTELLGYEMGPAAVDARQKRVKGLPSQPKTASLEGVTILDPVGEKLNAAHNGGMAVGQLYHIGCKGEFLERGGFPIQLPLEAARQLARSQAFLTQDSYYLYHLSVAEEITPNQFMG